MVKPNLFQSLTQKPTRAYNSGENSFYSPATDPYRRRPRTRSESGGDDTSSLRSLRSSSSIGDASSIRSSRSVGYNKGRPSKYSWSSTTLNEEPLPKTSRHYGNYLAERDRQSLIVRQPSISSTAERKRKESGERMKASSVPNLASGYNTTPKEIPSELPPPASQQPDASVQHRRSQSAGSPRRLRSLTRVQEEEEDRPPVPPLHSVMQNGPQRPPLHQTPSQRLAEEARAASQREPQQSDASSSKPLPILSPLSPRDYSQPFVLLNFELVLADSYVFSGKVTGKQDNRSPNVVMRLSRNRWATHEDHTATVTAVPFSNDADFSVVVHANAGDHLEFAVRMYMGTEEAWDSDGGKNFAIVLPRLHSRNAGPVSHTTPPMTQQRNMSKHKPQPSEGSVAESFVSASEGDYEDHRRSRAWVDSLPGRHLADPIDRPLSASASSSASSWDRQTATTTPNGSDSALAQSYPYHPAKYASALPPRIFLTRTESDRANLSSATYGEELANTPPAKDVASQPYFAEKERPISGLPEYMRQSANPARASMDSFRSVTSTYSTDDPRPSDGIRYGLVKDESAEAMPAPISLPNAYGPPPPLVPSAPVSRASSIKSERRSEEPNVAQRTPSPARSMNEVPFPVTQPPPSMMSNNVANLGQLFQPNDFAPAPPPRRRGSLDSHSIRSDYGPPTRRYNSVHGRDSSVTTVPRPKAASLMNAPAGSLSMSQRSTQVKAVWTTAQLQNPSNTMCAIAIAAGAAAAFSKKKAPKTRFFGGKRKPAAQLAGDMSDVRFTEIAELPSKPKGTEVLVQVWATALDFWDTARVETLVKRGDGFAFVPGRSFCGKIVDTGFDKTKFKRGDVVYGLADIKKSGALAELLLIDRRALSKAPDSSLSIEQMAAIPLAGVPAFYAMSTLAADLPQAAKLLVLNAHAGAGFMAIQLARHLRPDLHVTAHVAPDTLDAEALCKSNGATAVVRDESVVAIGRLAENSYSVVLDTIGGQRIYEAARRILHDEGVFVSLVGDDLSPVTVGKQWKAGFRSLKRAFTKKDRKSISYFLPIMTGEDHREALDSLRELVEQKKTSLTPNVKRVLRFENGEEAFKEEQLLLGGTVVRINEV